ncbi:MAG TPA: N-acetylmuramoyl-L-alanine amidase [Chitinophagaceae bacterium]|jgi:N-acetyl-anhydromuramyl-L-alanine amidase AmpD|nr:N-acetylmuramoyl-L-alanine amidase [Chitinophagaceae bacterium]
MRYTALPSLEEVIRSTGNNGEYTLRPVSVPVKGEPLQLQALFCTPVRRSGYYFDRAHPKARIVLHFTAGQTRSDLFTMTTHNRHVSVPFVIARDGTIYQLFSSRFWSGHIGAGIGNLSGNAQDKVTIGIELSNYGFLTRQGNNLETIYSRLPDRAGRPGPVDVYCSLDDTEAYRQLDVPFRNQRFYATHTPAQYESLIILLRYLTAQYDIPRAFLPEPLRYTATREVLSFRGIVSHINYRENGKWDIGPAFDWARVIAGVQAPAFRPELAPAAGRTRSAGAEPLTSEAALESLLPRAKDAAQEEAPYEEINESEKAAAETEKAVPPVFPRGIGLEETRPAGSAPPPPQAPTAAPPFFEYGSGGSERKSRFREGAFGGRAPESAAPPAAPFREGHMEYDIPGNMAVGRHYRCKVQIAGAEVAAARLKISETSIGSGILVSDEMSVRLIDATGDHFEINSLSSERQGVLPGEITAWSFSVCPALAGKHSLLLRVTVHLQDRNKDLDILEKQVVVTADAEEGPGGGKGIQRILFLAANPDDTSRLRLGAESREIQQELAMAADLRIAFTMNMAVTPRTLMRNIMQEKPHIVHFSGHGETEGLCLETEEGVSRLVDEITLGSLFSHFDETVQCVVLNACYSQNQAEAISRHIPYVIGMTRSIEDKAAIAFSIGFYMAIADGRGIPDAYDLGISYMRLETPGEAGVPVLLSTQPSDAHR